jgi:1,4-dihydroxy-2-naphthoate polyprenyltransferase
MTTTATAAAQRLPAPGSARAWVLACRPATLGAAIVPVAVGSACAYAAGGVRWGAALAALLGAVLIQIGTNLANDVFDAEKGADTAERLGPMRAVQAGLLSARQVRAGMALAFALATLCGAVLTWMAGPVVVAIGVASVLAGIGYTGGPYPLGYHGLGDLFVMAFFGFVAVCGTVFVELGHVTGLALVAALPVGALATAILVVNNLRDRATDAACGKRTLAVRLGRRGAIAEYAGLLALAYAVPVGVAVAGLAAGAGAPRAWAALPVLTAPLGVRLLARVARESGPALNPVLVATAKLLVLFGVLWTVGLCLG